MPGRDEQTHEAMLFVLNLIGVGLVSHDIPRIALENPIGRISTAYLKPDQVIQPWQFGHPETKRTCFWLKNLPKLRSSDIVQGRTPRVHHMPPSRDRWKERSRFFPGIAQVMADQWVEPGRVAPRQADLVQQLAS